MEARLRIGELAGRVGVAPKTIRYYEHVGLLPPPARSEHGYRLYAAGEEARLRFIVAARRVGFTLAEVKEMLALRDRGRPPCRYVAGTIERRIGEIDQQQDELRSLKAELVRLRERAKQIPSAVVEDGTYCRVLQH